MSTVLVLNSGSSSLKYRLLDDAETVLAAGLVERIGTEGGSLRHRGPAGEVTVTAPLPDHTAALALMMATCAEHGPELAPDVVGHRVVHGGARFSAPIVVDAEVEAAIEALSTLAPLHNPPGLLGIRAARAAFPDVPQVAVFDTAFHATMPPEASTYAVDAELAARYGVRRYGFHGTSHEYVSRVAADHLGRPDAKLVVLHLGNGASACAVDAGRSIATSMGLTPLEGLVMGTRGGDLDPGALLHLLRQGLDVDGLDTLLNRRSGLAGLTGTGDLRDVLAAAAAGDAQAELALDVYAHRVRGYVGAYLAHLGGLDGLVFTAGVGENSPEVRARVVAGLGHLGLAVDPARNGAADRGVRVVSPDGAGVPVLVVPTDEELQIARHALATVGG
ncbi:acetate/propionate family kinase [Modestobacter sp. Leaf380]|uniref:acetate/propionate family kinase n=1 Tax=Modestobacter sp. Leaf380 TaxID=1736356 RepID=UPI0006FB2D28|nr:acetate kinase [Modestobacter sp. Leaf380]KQS68483.1 acetate kinase [Modestobacter sp. Leaf380]